MPLLKSKMAICAYVRSGCFSAVVIDELMGPTVKFRKFEIVHVPVSSPHKEQNGCESGSRNIA